MKILFLCNILIDYALFLMYNEVTRKEVNKVNERIRQIRKSKDMTQQEFADSLDTSRNNVAGWEAGTRTPSAAALSLICIRHNVNKDFLYEGIGEMFVPETIDDEIAKFTATLLKEESDSFKNRLVSVLAKMTEEEWEMLERKMREVLGE